MKAKEGLEGAVERLGREADREQLQRREAEAEAAALQEQVRGLQLQLHDSRAQVCSPAAPARRPTVSRQSEASHMPCIEAVRQLWIVAAALTIATSQLLQLVLY